METLSHGFKKPEDNDKGQVIFDALEENIQKTNDHAHDGVESALIPSANISKTTVSIVAAGWTDPVNGVYSQIVTIPTGLFATTLMTFRETSTGKNLILPYEKVTDTSFKVFCNDASKDVTIIYA